MNDHPWENVAVFVPEPFQTKTMPCDIFISKVTIVFSAGKIYGHLSTRNEH